ncbi:hypothetical protein F442_22411, partial [Phytophthora nicotianae P10297]
MDNWFLAQAFKLSAVQHANYDDKMNHVANVVSEYACGLIETQYDFAMKRAAYSYNEDLSGLFVVNNNTDEEDFLDEPAAEYSVARETWSCSCKFMITHLLPCRH